MRTRITGLVGRLYEGVMRMAPSNLAAWIDYRRPSFRDGWGGPLNGQRQRQEIVRNIISAVAPDRIIETGTFRGGSTEFLSNLSGKPIVSIESTERYHLYARKRLAVHQNVDLQLGDSRLLLKELSSTADTSSEVAFFYLDAHWYEDLPAADEIKIISQNWKRAVIMIDDFAVDGDDGYSYDDYGPGRALTRGYLPDEELPGWSMYFPKARSSEETGARRGCIVLASPDLDRQMEQVPTLRPV